MDGRTAVACSPQWWAAAAPGKLIDVRRQSHQFTLALLTVAGISFALMQTLVVPALPFFAREFDTSASG